MKRLSKLFAVAFVLFLLTAGNSTVFALPNQNEDVSQQTGNTRATQIVCGELTRGSFGMYPSTHSYTVYLQGNKGVVFMSWGSSVITYTVCKPDGTQIATVNTIASGSTARYTVITTPNVSGQYKIFIQGACGEYFINCLTGYGTTANYNTGYSPSSAAYYAEQYWSNYNPAYYNFNNYGGDCTNFVSQCVFTGGMPMIIGQYDNHWYYTNLNNRSPSWTSADFFLRHWTKVRLSSYNGRAYSVKIYSQEYVLNKWDIFYQNAAVGDIVQYLSGSNSNAFHSAIITGKSIVNGEKRLIFCSHSSGMNHGSLLDYIVNNTSEQVWINLIRIKNN